ncbi:carboxypeptidase regulatory-like domain-containing protein [bacterium]|nr:carboxypeptidase regulatory-like domain-containing protein [bacterium]
METGDPIADADVFVSNGFGTTDEEGYYFVEGVFSGATTITVSADGYFDYMADVVLEAGLNTVDAEMEAVPGGQENTYFDDFEEDGGLFEANNAWAWGEPTVNPNDAYSGTHAWSTYMNANYNNNDDALLTTAVEWTLETWDAYVTYWHWFNYENSWDGYNFQISTDAGNTWNVIDPEGGYPDDSVVGLDGQPGFTANGAQWTQVTFDLTAYLGETVKLRFRHGTDGSVNGYPGVTFDDFEIYLAPTTTGTVEGIVSDNSTGDPVEGALVDFDGFTGVTDGDGYYFIDDVWATTYTAVVSAEGFWPAMVDVEVVEGDNVFDFGLDCGPEGTVDPEFFEFDVGWLGGATDILTVGNIGCSDMDFEVGVTYIEDVIAARGNNDQARRETVVQNLIARSGILDGPLTSYPLPTTIGANGPDVVNRPDQIARVIDGNGELDDANVLLYPADTPGYPEDVAAKLAALKIFETITIVDARFVVPTLEELMEYDAVMTWTNYSYLDAAGVGNVMADYVDEGYGVVGAVFESAGVYMLGRWNTEQYYAFPPSGNQFGPQQTLGEVLEDGHPMMEGIETLDGGTSSYRQSTMEVHPEALRIANWADGRAVAAVRDQMDNGITVDIGLFPPSNDVINGGWMPASDCDRLMANALLVASGASGGWLTVEPGEGTVEPEGIMDLDVLVDASQVELPGIYEATIDVWYDDGTEEGGMVTSWVTMNVGDPGSLEGTVYDSESGDPIEGALVTIWGELEDPVAELETDADGFYTYPLGTGDWDLMADAMGYYPSDIETAAVVEGEATVFDIALVHEVAPELVVDPEFFDFEAGWLGSDSDILTLSNMGGLPADWSASVTYIEDDEVNRMRDNARAYLNTRIVEAVTPNFNLASSTDKYAYPNIPTAPYANELDDPYFLIIQDADAWGAPAHQFFLDAMEVPYDIINSGQMADHDLGEYTCIIFTNVQSQNFLNIVMANEERFLGFMDDGGWIIFGGCTQNYTWNLWGLSNSYAPSGTGMNNMPEHEIMLDIPEQWTGGSDSHDIINDVPDDANVITTTSLGQPTLVEMEMGNGTILVNTMTWEIGWNLDWVNADILGNTIAYAVLYAGQGGWLSVEPNGGDLDVDEAAELDVLANAAGVELPGVFEATIDFNVAWPDTLEDVTVWVTFLVGDPGTLQGVVYDADTETPIAGAEVLIWGDLEEPIAELETDENGEYIYPLGTGDWDVWANAPGYYESDIMTANVVEGEVTQFDIALEHEVAPELVADPEFFEFEIEWGMADSDILTLGNFGGLPAEWFSDITYLDDEEIATANRAGLLERRARNLENIQLVQPADITGSTPGLMGMQDQDQQWEPELDEGPYLVLHTTDIAQSLQRALNELEVEEVTYMNTQAWNGIDFEGYNTVMVAMDGGTPTVADWNWVFDWCRAGGTLMLFGGTNWADAYNAMNDFCHHSGQQGWAQSAPPHINFEDGHPLNENLEDGTTFANNGASYYMFRFDDEEMDVASTNGDGWPNIFAKDVDNGTFVCFTSSAASVWWANQQDYEVYVQIVENCLNYAGGSGWLTIDPEDGYLEIDDVTDIDVLVDAVPDSLFGGVYEAMINFNVDWPDTLDPVTVWVTLNVNGGPPRHQWVTLQPNYFELISMNLNPERFNADAEEMFGPLVDLDIVYQNDGSVFIPPDINGIGNVDFHQAYRVHTGAEGVVHVLGDLIDVDEEYSLEAGSWKWLGYPFAHEVSASTALGEIEDDLIIVMNDQGHLWIPGLINTMGNMIPGEGYMTFVDDDVTFTFGGGGDVLASTSDEDIMPTPVVEDAPVATGLPYAVLVSFSDEVMSLEPAVVEIYDGNIMVGKGVVQEDYDVTPVITWQGSTGHALQGFKPGNPMSVVIRNASGAKLPVAIEETPKFGEGAYATLSLENSALPTEFAVKQGYPNPFNPSVTVPFALPRSGQVEFSVFNILGQEVFKSSTNFQAGYHRFLFDASRDGNELVSGVYFLQVNYNGQVKTQKLMLLK